MRHYLLALEPSGMLRYFVPFEHSPEAMVRRFEIETYSECHDVVVIGAPDLITLMNNHGRYFASIPHTHVIEHCIFCRIYLHKNDSYRLHRLTTEAKIQGHCLFCHQPYPRAGIGENEAIFYHTSHCAVLYDLG